MTGKESVFSRGAAAARGLAALIAMLGVVGSALGACRPSSGAASSSTASNGTQTPVSTPAPSPASLASAPGAFPATAPTAPPDDSPGRPGGGGGAGGGSGGGARRSAPFLFLDGQPLGAIQFGELPPGLVTTWERLQNVQEPVRRFSLAGYLRALGVDLKLVREVHIHSGRRRVATLTGAALLASPDTFFAFTRGTTGKVHMRWPTVSSTNDRIDKVNGVAVYQHKKPPTRDPKTGFLWLDGEEVDEPPYVTMDVQGGTRLYVDGRLLRVLRPRDLRGEEGPRPFVAELERLGVNVESLQSADLVQEDVLVQRLSGSKLLAASFSLPSGEGGVAQFGADRVSVILLAVRKPPTDWSAR